MTVNEDLLLYTEETGKPIFRVYEPEEVEVVLGAGCKKNNLLLDNISRDGVAVRTRKGGGGTVVLSPGQVVVALSKVVGSPFDNLEYMRGINEWIIDALSLLGVREVEHRGVSDLAMENRKILGASLHRKRRILFYQSSLLVSNDISLFSRYLKYPPREPDYRLGRSHEEFCTNLKAKGFDIDIRELIDALKAIISDRIALLW